MNCEDYQDQLTQFLLGELDQTDSIRVEQHLANGCASCSSEFVQILEGVELMYQAVPVTAITERRRQQIFQQALRAESPAAQSAEAVFSIAGSHMALRQSEFKRSSFGLLSVQSVLALATGFLIMCGVQMWVGRNNNSQRSPQQAVNSNKTPGPSALGNALASDAEIRQDSRNAISFISLSPKAAELNVNGYFLADLLSGELHVVGHFSKPPQPHEGYTATVVSSSTETVYPLTIEAGGLFKLKVPLPVDPIREIIVRSSTEPSAKATLN